MSLCILSLILILTISCHAMDQVAEKQIILRPGFPEKEVLELGDIACSFSYQVEGGSSEEWVLTLEMVDGEYVCGVGSWKGRSYLLFYAFEIELQGGRVNDYEVSEGGKVLKDVKRGESSVGSVEGFQGLVSSIMVRGDVVMKGEL